MNLVSGYLEIQQEPHRNFPNDETDKREDEGDEEALAGDQGAATPQEGDGEADQAGRQDGVGDHGELLPAGPEVEVLRHQEGGPGRGQEGPEQHDQGVDSADTASQHEVTTPPTHLARPHVLLSGSNGWGVKVVLRSSGVTRHVPTEEVSATLRV